MKEGNEFQKINNPFIVIVSSKKSENNANFVFTDSAEGAIETLQKEGFSEALVAGGGLLNSSFVQKGLIDEIYLDIESVIFGKGVKLFAENDFETNLELLSTKQLSKNTVQLHYKVIH